MTHEELFNKYAEIMNDDALVEEFKKVKNNEEARAFLRANGVDASDDELDGILEAIIDYSKQPLPEEDELSADQLEQVAGGGALSFLVNVAKKTWEVGTAVAGALVYGSQKKAKQEIVKYWSNALKRWIG